ncbi:Stage III sporulation protein AE [bioreactor metagenome]|uniref:Stage III sporulation protein AE n=1 Tax=bioreactor metagenome TaxID=1076179 RepID=A0A645GD59_9ZZZZ
MLLTLLTALGGSASAGIFQPAMALLSGTVSTVVCGVVLPIILAMGMLAVISNMTDRTQLSQLYGLGKTTSKWILGFTFTMFFALMSLQGITAASFDGISVRTAKFMIDKFVPIVGKMVSDTVDTVLGCTLIIKNALGISAIMITLMVIIAPMLRIAASIFVYRIGAALIEPVADKKLTQMISMMADVSTYLFVAMISVGAMLIISIGLIMSAGNANIMIR